MTSEATAAAAVHRPIPWLLIAGVVVALAAMLLVYSDGLALMVKWWEREEYSHGYLIPVVALFLLWQRLPLLEGKNIRPAWIAVGLVLVALAFGALGELSALYTVVQYAFLLALYALVLSVLGWRGSWLMWAPLAYLIFMIPLPNFLYFNLSQQLQLISSELGVWVIRLFGITVFLEGNVIDLGTYKLQVVEACSGLRYLFPLMSFGFLIAYLYRGPLWQRWLIFLSTLPITVLMNSFRIGVIGVTVEYWGTAAAEGFLHDFEGWAVFMACLALLCVEVWLLNWLSGSGRSMWDQIDLTIPSVAQVKAALPESLWRFNPVLIAVAIMLVVAVPLGNSMKHRTELQPARQEFTRFPLVLGDWMGQEGSIENEVLSALKLTDYIKVDYRRGSADMPVNFYVAYYASQRKGSSIHSPRSCIPGGGWVIASHTVVPVPQVPGADQLKVNRLVIQKGASRQLVYYWFDQRGRVITNEYLAKWYLFQDSLTRQRTDGALVRLVTPVINNGDIAEADARLQAFMREAYPLLGNYIPR